jgi:hypothetical protein
MAEPKPEQMMVCPYNKAHQVAHYRMHIHLQKCRKQHPNSNKATCPFDATHVVNDVEIDVSFLSLLNIFFLNMVSPAYYKREVIRNSRT